MEIIKTIRDKDLGWDFESPSEYKERGASRAIVFDNDKKVALLHAKNKSYHKLPGGRIENGEDTIDALKREMLEEIGCKIINIRELGIIEEFRNKNKFALHQLSHCFIADLDGEKGIPQLEADEVEDGFEPAWVSIDEAIQILETEKERVSENYEGRFIINRDLILLNEVKNKL